jgi:gliding motility-associated-like protein
MSTIAAWQSIIYYPLNAVFMKIGKVLLPLFLFIVSISARGQLPTCPDNIDFENGTLLNWNFFNGTVATGPVYTLFPSAPVSGRENLMSTGVDPYGFFPVVGAGMYSCRLGHDTINYCAEKASYQVHIPIGIANYSLIYRYAIILEDPGSSHLATEKPRFEVSAYDSVTKTAVPCAQFNYVASSTLPGFKLSTVGYNVWYRTWSLGSMNLSGLGGKTVTIDFVAADCTQGGHFGYGYLDMSCGLFAINNISCNSATITLTAPGGDSTYGWYDSATFTHFYGNTDTIVLPTPGGPTTYAVVLYPYPGYGCLDTLYTRVVPTSLNYSPSHDTTICVGSSVKLKTGATDIALPLKYTWSTSSGGSISCSSCDSTIVTPKPGVNYFKYTVVDAAGCSITDSVKVSAIGVVPLMSHTNVSCHGRSDGSASAIPFTGAPPFAYSWSTTPPQTTSAITGLVAGTYTVSITDVTGCAGKAPVTITEPPPTFITLDGSSNPTRCFLNDGTITLGGFVPMTAFNIRYRFNGVPTIVSLLSSSTGKVTIIALGAGFYDSISVAGALCPYNTVGPVTLVGPPKPPPPPVTPQRYCQFEVAKPAIATGTDLLWYGAGIAGVIVPPVPSTLLPGVTYYYVTQMLLGCVSDSSVDSVLIVPMPAPPITADTMYCQHFAAPALTAIGDSLQWYRLSTGGSSTFSAPVPSTDHPGDSTWYVNQTVNGCPSNRSPLTVTVKYKPVFSITAQRPWVCQYDSIWFSYDGPALVDPSFVWSIPNQSYYSLNLNKGTSKSFPTDSMVYVRFDSVIENNYVRLFVSNYHGMCFSDTFMRMPVIPHPTATSFSKVDVCVGDTVSLALSSRSANAAVFSWTVDNIPMETTDALSIIAHNSNSGGPFSISWNDSGHHVIAVTPSTVEGCINPPVNDTINVHLIPDATFKYLTRSGPLCLEDSIMFIANATDYNYSYEWSPSHFFQNINKGVTWGKVEQSRSNITLKVSDPFGCVGTHSQEIDPNSCCTVGFPTAFTPNGDHKNDVFRPIYAGYHRFHIFRIANRWGQTVYESTNSNMQWDGNFNGVPQDMGVYFYYLKYDCGGNTIEKTGDVTLVR